MISGLAKSDCCVGEGYVVRGDVETLGLATPIERNSGKQTRTEIGSGSTTTQMLQAQRRIHRNPGTISFRRPVALLIFHHALQSGKQLSSSA